jgi:hypothetical protein
VKDTYNTDLADFERRDPGAGPGVSSGFRKLQIGSFFGSVVNLASSKYSEKVIENNILRAGSA